ncbi:MAG: DUF3368 domain-containing protein [Phycisphaerales bacterium]
MIVVSDTSPLRALPALELVGLLESIYRTVLIPPAVAGELGRDAPNLGPFRLADHAFIEIEKPKEDQLLSRLRAELDEGEAQALALAKQIGAELVLVDELAGRRAARRLGLEASGVLAVLVLAKYRGLVPQVAPLLDRLDSRIRFRVSAAVRRRVLEDAGESHGPE